MAHNLKTHLWGIAIRKPTKYRGSLEDVNIIMRPYHTQKRIPNP
jgi:hypothetical protein